ncbi:MAG: RNA polymerase sigma-70 factor [Candidatus Symbiothrix sp.]|jgi:RNA polymerase sigma-70 factor (ECF subfamily)|nr:RNA polymerase sigma-70 factor [Candidatus Symbiothrix sp.]
MFDSSTSDKSLAEAMHDGSKQAFEAIYQKYHRLLYSVAFRYLSSTEDAEDATADVFVRLWEIRREVVIETSLRNFLYTMLKNYILNQIRGSKPVFLTMDGAEIYQKEDEELVEELLEKKEMRNRLYKAIHSLPEQKRKICLFKMEENLKNEEIAQRMNISLNTVKTHYLLALRMLRMVLHHWIIFIIALTQIQ